MQNINFQFFHQECQESIINENEVKCELTSEGIYAFLFNFTESIN